MNDYHIGNINILLLIFYGNQISDRKMPDILKNRF